MTDTNKGVVNPTTPSTAIIPTNESFQGIPVRIVSVEGKDMIVVVDIARSLQIDRSNLTKSLKDDLFKDQKKTVKITTAGGSQKVVCLTSYGAVGLLYKVDAKESQTEEVRERIRKFQNWATELIEKKMQVQVKLPVYEAPRQSGAVTDTMQHYMEAARAAHREMGVPLDLAMSKALVLAGRDLHMDLTGFARLLPPAQDQIIQPQVRMIASPIDTQGYLSASEIAQYLNRRNGGNLRGKHINTYLKQNGFIYPREEDGRYCMTEKGSEYGKVFPFAARSGHVDYFLRWKPEVMQASGMIRQ
jgi:prophage antirepressor-like protein